MTTGGKLLLGGAALALVGAAALAGQLPWPWSPVSILDHPQQAAPMFAGLALAALGTVVYVLEPALEPELARSMPVASIRTNLAMLVTVLILANLASLPLADRPGRAAAGGMPSAAPLGPLQLTYVIAASELPLIFVVWLRLVLPGCLTWRDLGLRAGPIVAQLRAGLSGGAALFVTAGIVGAVLTRLGVRQNQFERFEGIEGAPLGLFVLAFVAGCVMAPLAEELFFRGYIFQTIKLRRGHAAAYIYSAGLFALVHGNLAAAAPIFVLGLLLAYIFQRTNSVIPGVIAHGVNNAIAFLLLYAGFRG